jgi:hypothetical protein
MNNLTEESDKPTNTFALGGSFDSREKVKEIK